MTDIQKKIAKLAEDEKSDWLEKARNRRENRSWLRKSQYIALLVLSTLQERDMQQKELAELLGVSPQQISKILKGKENLTLETISKLEKVLDISLVEIPIQGLISATKKAIKDSERSQKVEKSDLDQVLNVAFSRLVEYVQVVMGADKMTAEESVQEGIFNVYEQIKEGKIKHQDLILSSLLKSIRSEYLFTTQLNLKLKWKNAEKQIWEKPRESEQKMSLVG